MITFGFITLKKAAEMIPSSAPVSEPSPAERAFVEAVAKAVLGWAGLSPEEAESPDHEMINIPDNAAAKVIGKKALMHFKADGFSLDEPALS